MLTSTVVVTLRGPLKTVDMELPGDAPVSELVPVLLEICTSHNPHEWQQAFNALLVGGVPLSLERTLVEAGVCDGTILVLQTNDAPSPQDETLAPQQFVPRSLQPGVETGGIGVTWHALV
jgi:hypothetical protein